MEAADGVMSCFSIVRWISGRVLWNGCRKERLNREFTRLVD